MEGTRGEALTARAQVPRPSGVTVQGEGLHGCVHDEHDALGSMLKTVSGGDLVSASNTGDQEFDSSTTPELPNGCQPFATLAQ